MRLVVLLALLAAACSGTVDVHGIPEEIQLRAPFCVPPSADAAPAAEDAGADDAAISAD